ncbi:hypothetical protein B0H66DRAFT_543465 [Apodospora peruviana]|uniref:Zinc finger PHD-type domain-containing protein n=1 Tax=Apodospora peruviana TaxID=516989 RepID=A0AAE0ISQ2_9PEZI|nr:hypothetical protein B0H66DRAFT_543465 [Apodospora peruviana]
MPVARKRALQEDAGSGDVQPPKQPSILHRVRNMWQFANLFQFILLFGKALKLDDNIDIEYLEGECLKPSSTALQDIGLGLLKFLSSHRGLTHESFDEYTRRQFLSKAPEKNPFGTEEVAARFANFDVFQKIRVLQHMTQLIMMNPDRLRERTDEQKDMEQTNWRIEPYGWDSKDRTYFVLDDNRIYRLTEAPPPAAKPKKNSKKARAAQRASKRRRISAAGSDSEDAGDQDPADDPPAQPEDDGFGGMKWECIAVTLEEVHQFLSMIRKSKDDNERVLRDQIQEHLVPILEKQEESRKRKQLQREKELINLERMAHAKRSSRIASKAEHQKLEEQAREEERKRREEEVARNKEEQRLAKIERERERRLKSREHRLKEREVRRLQHEEELAQLSEDSKSVGSGPARMSERQRQAEIEKNKEALKELEEEEGDWVFDCTCGVYGQVDDGTHSVACERCNVWQHSKCLGIDEKEADADDFHFVCSTCRRIEQAEKDPRPRIIKIKVNRTSSPSSSSPPQKRADENFQSRSAGSKLVVELESRSGSGLTQLNGPNHAPQGGLVAESAQKTNLDQTEQQNGNNAEDSRARSTSPADSATGQQNNPFSSQHPHLSPPDQSPNKSKAYETIFGQSCPVADAKRPRLSLLDGQAHTMNGSLPVLSPPTGSGSGPSPSKQARQSSSPPPTKTSPSAPPTSRDSGAALPARNLNSTPSASAILPHLTPQSERGIGELSSPLPPSRGGLSPTKHSPPLPQHGFHQMNGTPRRASASTVQTSTVFPPSAALPPSPQQQILTPPVKSADPARAPS